MVEFVLDPYMYTSIKVESREEAEIWKKALEEWVYLTLDYDVVIKSNSDCISALEGSGELLNVAALKEMRDRFGLEMIDDGLLLRMLRRWIDSPLEFRPNPYEGAPTILPAELISRNQGTVGTLFGKFLESLAMSLQAKAKRSRDQTVPVVLTARIQEGHPKIIVSLPLEQSSCLSRSNSDKPELGTQICLDMLGSISDMSALDPIEAFRAGEKLFRCFLEESARATTAELPKVTFHKELLGRISESRINSHVGDFREFVSTCIHVLNNTADRKEFRQSGNSLVQETRSGNWKAWRVHITKRGAGWRLNYWERRVDQGREVEFAWIEKKNEKPWIPR